MTEDFPQPAPANVARDPRMTGELYEDVAGLLGDEKLLELSPLERGKVIVDRFVGHLVAKGGVKDSEDKVHSPTEILDQVALALNSSPQGLGEAEQQKQWDDSLSRFTRTDGLRYAVHLLASDSSTSGWLAGGPEKLLTGEAGKPTLTSLHQLEGYLFALAGTSPVAWPEKILEHVEGYAKGQHVNGIWDAASRSNLLSSDVHSVKAFAEEWERRVVPEAEQAGVNMDLIGRSAEELKERVQAGEIIAHTVLKRETNYDEFF